MFQGGKSCLQSFKLSLVFGWLVLKCVQTCPGGVYSTQRVDYVIIPYMVADDHKGCTSRLQGTFVDK